MEIKQKLPPLFLRYIERIQSGNNIWSVKFKSDVDAYGFYFEVDYIEIFDLETIVCETRDLPIGFEPDGCYGESDEEDERRDNPGFIPDIIDFTKIVCFGDGGDASPFCFDFREDMQNPSIIWWADDLWRRIAAVYETFRALLILES